MHNTGVKPQLRKCCRKKGGIVSFSKMRTFARGGEGRSLLCKRVQARGGGGSRKGQFYANVITEWPLGKWDDSKEN